MILLIDCEAIYDFQKDLEIKQIDYEEIIKSLGVDFTYKVAFLKRKANIERFVTYLEKLGFYVITTESRKYTRNTNKINFTLGLTCKGTKLQTVIISDDESLLEACPVFEELAGVSIQIAFYHNYVNHTLRTSKYFKSLRTKDEWFAKPPKPMNF